MALIHCPECNKEISDKAITCPHCGYGLNSAPVITAHKRSNAIPVFLLICFLVGGFLCLIKISEIQPDITRIQMTVDLAEGAMSLTGSSNSTEIYIRRSSELKELKRNRLIFGIITGVCALSACISTIIIVTNNKHNKQIKSHN